MSFGLAFAGGGTKGATHVGVLKAFDEFKLKPSAVAGTSSGSIVAGLYAMGFTVTEMENIVHYLSKKGLSLLDPNYKQIAFSIFEFFTHKPLSLSGLIKGKKLEKYLCDITDNIYINSIKTQLIIPSVDLNSGLTIAYTNSVKKLNKLNNVIWKDDIKLGSAMYASSAIPGIFEPKILSNMCLVDGGVTDVLPIELLSATYENNIIAVDISDEYEMPDNYGILEIASHSLSLMRERLAHYKNSTGLNANKFTSEYPDNLLSHFNNLSIKPDLPDKSGLFTFTRMNDCMKCGYETAKKVITQNLSKFY